MRRSELFALFLVLIIILITEGIYLFYDDVKKIIETKFVLATEIKKSEKKNLEEPFKPLKVVTFKNIYHRYELVEILVNYRDINKRPITSGKVIAYIYKNGRLQKSIGNLREIRLVFNPKYKLWVGKWPVPWKAEEGKYRVFVKAMPDYPAPVLTASTEFEVVSREIPKPEKGLCVVVMEHGIPILRKVPPLYADSIKKDKFNRLIEWVKFTGADGFFVLAGETATYNPRVNSKTPFIPDRLREAKKLLKIAKQNGLITGAWIMSFGYNGGDCEKIGYKPSYGYNVSTGRLYKSYMHISLNDEKRIRDIINLVKKLDKEEYIDFIGLDYIRTGHVDGYELADSVVRDMSIPVPENWNKWSEIRKAIWLARKIKIEKDPDIIERWQWWRAHKEALFINRVKKATRKPIWGFTLGWKHGREHGQDPLMFTDAGLDFDAVMLYEANQRQFRTFLYHWKGYLSSKDINILVGQTVDIKLLDSNFLFPTEELVRRIIVASKKITFDGKIDGVFWHDVSRGFWGNKGIFTTKEWFITAGRAFSLFRENTGENEIKSDITIISRKENKVSFIVKVENQSYYDIKNIKVSLIPVNGVFFTKYRVAKISKLEPGEIKKIHFQVYITTSRIPMIAATIRWGNKKSFVFKYPRYSDIYIKL